MPKKHERLNWLGGIFAKNVFLFMSRQKWGSFEPEGDLPEKRID